MLIKKEPDTSDKLSLLSRSSQYDLACACGTRPDEHRRRSKEDKWIYPVSLPQGGTTFLFKTLLSNRCVSDCTYCPLRAGHEIKRCELMPHELAKTFLAYWRAKKVSGLFLSNALGSSADGSMDKINSVGHILRRSGFRGYMHLKIIPGASDAAIRDSLSLATAVSVNIEVPGEKNFARLCTRKDYARDILRPLELISKLTRRGAQYSRIKQTTQFVVGASEETDKEIITYSWKLYKELGLNRVYFSAYQRGAGDANVPGEHSRLSNAEMLMREHRLYQVDWLLRKYGFHCNEIPLTAEGNLSLSVDPKEAWARAHPEFYPLNINRATKDELLRVPGLGQITVERIIALRTRHRIRSLASVSKPNKRLEKARQYIHFGT